MSLGQGWQVARLRVWEIEASWWVLGFGMGVVGEVGSRKLQGWARVERLGRLGGWEIRKVEALPSPFPFFSGNLQRVAQ